MPKYMNEGKNARRNLGVSSAEDRGISKVVPSQDRESLTEPMQVGGQKVDPSVRLGPLKGPAAHGEVAMATTMRKPQAYRK